MIFSGSEFYFAFILQSQEISNVALTHSMSDNITAGAVQINNTELLSCCWLTKAPGQGRVLNFSMQKYDVYLHFLIHL